MRVLYAAADPVPFPKGAGVRIQRTVEALASLGHQVNLLTLPAPDGARLSLAGVTHHTAQPGEGNVLQRLMAFRRQTAAWLEEHTADMVQVRGIWEGIPAVVWAQAKGARLVLEAHGFPSVEMPYHHPALLESPDLLDKLVAEEQAVLCAADLVLTPSRTSRRFLLTRGVSAQRIALVPNVVDTQTFVSPAAPPPDEPPLRLVYTGTLAPWQGLELLVEALARFRGKGEVELHLLGTQKRAWRRQLRDRARAARVHHMVHLAGATTQTNLVPVLQQAHACVAPLPLDPRNAMQGCCPLKVLEYMACGRPILATRIPPLLELLRDGLSAHLVQPGSVAELAAGIRWLLDHPEEREAMGARARQEALGRFDHHRFATWLDQALALKRST